MERPDARAEKAQADGAGEFGNSINKEGYAVQETTAILSNELLDDHQYTVFAFGGVVLRFRAPDCLQAYTGLRSGTTAILW